MTPHQPSRELLRAEGAGETSAVFVALLVSLQVLWPLEASSASIALKFDRYNSLGRPATLVTRPVRASWTWNHLVVVRAEALCESSIPS